MTTLATPPRSLAQRRQAIDLANDVRMARAELKHEIKAGRRRASPLLVDPPERLRSMPVLTLLRSLPGYGPVKVDRVLRAHEISHRKTVGGLSDRQRSLLLSWLRGR